MHEDFERCYRAVQSKDARFDGWFVTAVLTTGIYCRPSCPVRPPFARNVRFFPTAAAAQHGGFRACKRCRPDASPGSPEWDARSDLVGRAMRLIADGVVDRDGVGGLASRLGYSARQLERVLVAEVGAGPLALARAQRAQSARLLIETSDMAFAQVAFAAGFASIRQFNDTVRLVFDATPSALRSAAQRRRPRSAPGALTFRLPFRRPFLADAVFARLAATAVPGCEETRGRAHRRTMRLPSGHGIATLEAHDDHVACELRVDDVRDVPTAIARCRRLLDLDADPEAIEDCLAADPALAPLVRRSPGRRIARSTDANDQAIRIVLNQQVSIAAAVTHAGRLAGRYGTPITDPDGGLDRVFPSFEQLADVDPAHMAVPAARRRCLTALVAALADGSVDLGPGADWHRARDQLARIEGIGPWSAEMIAMRGLGDPDALPVGDLGVRRGAQALGLVDAPAALTRRAAAWRPWRSYAVQHLWAESARPSTAEEAR